jgi:polyisoprenoid-binding protein YceI
MGDQMRLRDPKTHPCERFLAGICLAWTILFLNPVTTTGQEIQEWRIDAERSRIVVHVDAAGLFSPFLKDHHFVPEQWSGSFRFDPDRPELIEIEVSVVADSLHNLQADLSPEDRETVDRQVRSPDILHVERYPEVRFSGSRMEIDQQVQGDNDDVLRGTLVGDLTIRGETRQIQIPFAVRLSTDWLGATGQTSFLQTDFGIERYSRFLGTVAVQDRVRVELEIEAVPVR